MKTSWGKPVHVISFIRTLLITLSVGVCLATLMGCGNKPEEDASPAADVSPATYLQTPVTFFFPVWSPGSLMYRSSMNNYRRYPDGPVI
jgi:hypothetical protein